MFTRCPGCHTVHPVNAALLAQGAGRYRCGKCNKLNNALEALFDEWPAASAQPPASGDVPVLGLGIDLDAAARAREVADGEDAETEALPKGRGASLRWLVRLAWIAGILVLAVVIVLEVADFQGEPLQERAQVKQLMESAGLREPEPVKPFRDLDRIHLISRELRADPDRPGRLRLAATIVNRARQRQPYPELEITLLDAAGQPVQRQRFSPADYLAPGTPPDAGMAPEAYVPLVLLFDDPGVRAVGFELEFR